MALPGSKLWLAGDEVVVYGAGLADGYLDRPTLTERQFRVRDTPDGPQRCYHTGDRARLGPFGTVAFLGRLDDQVKLLGHRIELGEVEAVLEAHPAVRQIVALLRDRDNPLRAHLEVLVTAGEAARDDAALVRELRQWAAGRLPAAVPRHIRLGPGAAGLIVATGSAPWALIADAATFACSAALLTLLPRGGAAARDRERSLRRELVEGWSVFSRTPWVWTMVVSFAAYQATVLPALFVIGPVTTQRAFGSGAWAGVLTARSIGGLLGGLVLMGRRPARPLAVATLLLLLDVPMLVALSGTAGLPALLLTCAVSAAGATAADILWETSLQHYIAPELLSRVSSYDWMGSVLFAPLGFVLIGSVAAAAGSRDTLLAVLAVHSAVHVALPLVPAIRRIGP